MLALLGIYQQLLFFASRRLFSTCKFFGRIPRVGKNVRNFESFGIFFNSKEFLLALTADQPARGARRLQHGVKIHSPANFYYDYRLEKA